MPSRIAVVVLTPLVWTPAGADPRAWRVALADDMMDVLATLSVDAGVAVPAGQAELAELAAEVGWPGSRRYQVAALDVVAVLDAVAADGYDEAVLLAPDAPDLPAMVVAKMFRPLTTRAVAAAAATGTPGLVGLAVALPAPPWLPARTLDELTPQLLRSLAPAPADVALTAAWHRLRTEADLSDLDPGLEGWEAVRATLAQLDRA